MSAFKRIEAEHMLQLIRVLIFGIVFTGIALLSAMRGVVLPAHAAQSETISAPAAPGR